MKQHLVRSSLTPRRHSARWLSGLVSAGLKPTPLVLETIVAGGDWEAAERKWIAHYRALGARLTNQTNGGEGVGGYKMPAEVREKHRQRLLGRVFDDEWKRKISAARKGQVNAPQSEESKRKRVESIRATLIARIAAETHCKRGHARTPETAILDAEKPWIVGCRQCLVEARRARWIRVRPPAKTHEEILASRAAAGLKRRLPPELRKRKPPKPRKPGAVVMRRFGAGEAHSGAKLTWEKVDQIRARCAAGESRRLVGESFDIALTTVDQIVQGKSWRPETRPQPQQFQLEHAA